VPAGALLFKDMPSRRVKLAMHLYSSFFSGFFPDGGGKRASPAWMKASIQVGAKV
jgi:hypothetical protein